MATVNIRHKVEDYASWKRGYDEADWLRKQHGIKYASAVSPLMENIGVIGKPEIWFAENLEPVTYS